MQIKEDILKQYKNVFKDCVMLFQKYELPCEKIEKNIHEIDEFKVTTPVIGSFSTGKSSMINAILENDVLSTEITPETSIPTEVYYGNNRVLLYDNQSTQKEISINEYKSMDLDINNTKLVKLECDNEFLKQIKNVKIVDMPGFDSGIELHNRAIDEYLPYSLAYIITFSANEPVIKESIADFLSELKLHEVPVYVVLTKCDKPTNEELEKCIEFMKNNVPKLLGIDDVKIVCEKSKRDRDVTEVKKILLEIQQKSQEIFKKKFSIELKESCMLIEKYILSRIKGREFSESELEDKERKLEENISEIMVKLKKEKMSFQDQTQKCIGTIKSRINSELLAAAPLLENMIYNHNDIKDKINLIVRNAVTCAIKSEFEPKLQRYLKNVVRLIHVDIIADTEVNLDSMEIAVDDMVKDVALKTLPAIIAVIGSIFEGPILGIITAAFTVIVEALFKSKHEKEKRELISQKVRGEIIPQIIEESGKSVADEINSYVVQIDEEIQGKVQEEKMVMEKSLEDIRKQKKQEEEFKKKELDELNSDLEKVRGILNGI